MLLLHKFILTRSRSASVKIVDAWPRKWSNLAINDRIVRLMSGLPPDSTEKYILFDNGQDTYWDTSLWETLFKSIPGMHDLHLILFCAYGSPTSHPLEYDSGTPMVLDAHARISLLPSTDEPDQFGSVGLLFTREEFGQVIQRAREMPLDIDAQDEIYKLTGGHAGAVADILEVLAGEASFDKFLPGFLLNL